MIRKNLIKSLSVVMATMLAVMTVACGQATTDTQNVTAVEESAEEAKLEESIVKNSVVTGNESDAGKVETVYVTADANGAVNDVIVSEWLKNATASTEIADSTELKDIVNVKGEETYKENSDGTLTWDAEGSDIFYQGTTDKELPVTMKITYTLDGKEISPEELAGKSGRVTIRFEYENNAKQTVNVDGKDIEVYTPFAMVSGMMLDADKFTNVEISNGKVISDGGNYVVMGVALPGLKESLDISEDKWDKLDDADEIKEKLSNSFEITADTSDFELGMTITMASSDILSDFGLTDITGSDKIQDLKSDMGDLNDGGNKLVDGAQALMDGAVELKDGTGKLYDGTTQLYDGTGKLYDGAGSLAEGTSKLYDGTGTLKDGTGSLVSGTDQLAGGVQAYLNGASQIKDGSATLAQGTKDVKSGSEQLKAGADQLYSGADELNKQVKMLIDSQPELNAKLTKLQGSLGALQDLQNRRQAYVNAYKFLMSGEGITPEILATLNEFSKKAGGPELTAETATMMVKGAKQTVEGAGGLPDEIPDLISPIDAATGMGAAEGTDASPANGSATPAAGIAENTSEDETTVSVPGDNNLSENEVIVTGDTITEDGDDEDGDDEDGKETVEIPDTQVPLSQDVTNPEPSNEPVPKLDDVDDDEEDDEDGDDDDEENVSLDAILRTSADETSNVQLGESNKTADDYEKMIADLQKELDNTKTELNETKTQLTGAQQAAGMYRKAAGGYKQYAEGAISLKKGVALVEDYNKLLGATQAAIASIDEVLGMADQMGLTEKEQAQLSRLLGSTTALSQGTKKLAAGAKSLSDGVNQLDGGLGDLNAGANKLAAGANELTSNNGKLSDGVNQLSDGAKKLDSGAAELRDGAGQLNSGAQELLKGAGDLNDGAKDLNDGAKQLDDGVVTLEDGMQQLLDGVIKLDEEGIKRLYEAFDGDLSDFADRMSAIQEAGKSYNSFGGSSEEENSSVKFIFKTDSIKSL
ncbi:MAG: hypothetical protein J6O03_06265 [Butyrivibrio sp.]|nr:hypothetical protein [Butyrivibrio sp.]